MCKMGNKGKKGKSSLRREISKAKCQEEGQRRSRLNSASSGENTLSKTTRREAYRPADPALFWRSALLSFHGGDLDRSYCFFSVEMFLKGILPCFLLLLLLEAHNLREL